MRQDFFLVVECVPQIPYFSSFEIQHFFSSCPHFLLRVLGQKIFFFQLMFSVFFRFNSFYSLYCTKWHLTTYKLPILVDFKKGLFLSSRSRRLGRAPHSHSRRTVERLVREFFRTPTSPFSRVVRFNRNRQDGYLFLFRLFLIWISGLANCL